MVVEPVGVKVESTIVDQHRIADHRAGVSVLSGQSGEKFSVLGDLVELLVYVDVIHGRGE